MCVCVLSGDRQNRTERMPTGEGGKVCVCVWKGGKKCVCMCVCYTVLRADRKTEQNERPVCVCVCVI